MTQVPSALAVPRERAARRKMEAGRTFRRLIDSLWQIGSLAEEHRVSAEVFPH